MKLQVITLSEVDIQVVLISSATSILVFLLGWFIKFFYEKYSLSFKLKKEYEFEQVKRLKEEIAKNKIHLLNAAEAFNNRMWNFNQNVSNRWHKITRQNWFSTRQYYLNSFIFMFLSFLYWVLKTESDTISVDTTIAHKNDITYLKWIKTFKDIFTDAQLLEGLGYNKALNTNHFFKHDLPGYANLLVENGVLMNFARFNEELRTNYDKFSEVIEYFTVIEDRNDDKNLNVLRCYHLLAIRFLNGYGHDYQHTSEEKLKTILATYKSKIKITAAFETFVEKSKLKIEMKWIMKKLKP